VTARGGGRVEGFVVRVVSFSSFGGFGRRGGEEGPCGGLGTDVFFGLFSLCAVAAERGLFRVALAVVLASLWAWV
jgi:hypothetical protein